MTDLILSLIPGQWIAWAAVAVAALSAMWFGGRKSAKNDAAKQYQHTRKAIDEETLGNDPDAARRWLRERGDDAAICDGTKAARKAHAAALATDGGDQSVLTGALLIRQLDAGCGQ